MTPFSRLPSGASGQFLHGVASGDPQSDGFVIWTRITPENPTARIETVWEVSKDELFNNLAASGNYIAKPEKDWTVKIELDGLDSGQIYYYRFKVSSGESLSGRSRTLPKEGVTEARFAVVSCSNYPFGYFNVYDHIAAQTELDAVIHLGDYIYEYGRDGYGGKVGAAIGREHQPSTEILSLADYRQRHAQYKSDTGSQKMLAAHPLIAIWDDHETTNNSWENGAQNHQENEGNWEDRKSAALQAYYEWMPVRDPKAGRAREALFKNYQWGDLLSLATLETRLTARSEQLDYANLAQMFQTPEDITRFQTEILGAPDRQLMGSPQLDYIAESLRASKSSGTAWRLIANQVIMADVAAPNLADFATDPAIDEIEKELPQIRSFLKLTELGLPLNLDAWDGYPAAREKLYSIAQEAGARDLLVLTGDTHEYWLNDLYRKDGLKMGIELGTAGVTSPGASTYFGSKGQDYSDRLVARNKSVKYHDPVNKGYIDLALSRGKARAKFVAVDTVLKPNYRAFVSAAFDIIPAEGSLSALRT